MLLTCTILCLHETHFGDLGVVHHTCKKTKKEKLQISRVDNYFKCIIKMKIIGMFIKWVLTCGILFKYPKNIQFTLVMEA